MPNPEKPSWMLRRVAIFSSLVICWAIAIYIVGWGADNELHRTAFVWAMGSAVVVVSSYAGFATLEDIKMADILRRK